MVSITRSIAAAATLSHCFAASWSAGERNSSFSLRVDSEQGIFVDEYGRTVLLRGIVQMADTPAPWLSEAQVDTLASYGFNIVRLGFVWHLYEIAPGRFNETYMDELAATAERLAVRGIRSIVDSHQDWLSPMYCRGRGIPEFYAYPDTSEEFQPGGAKAFPQPLLAAQGYEHEDPWAGDFGHVDASTCDAVAGFGWPLSYNTYAAGRAMQRFYDDEAGALTKFTEMWQRVARRFRSVPGVAFYEIFNEPWPGDTFARPELLDPSVADVANVERMNRAVHEAIRTVDNDTVLLFEPAISSNSTGLQAGPGAADGYADREAYAYHMYIPESMVDYTFGFRVEDTQRLATAGFLSEFGAVSEDSEAGLAYLEAMLNRSDAERVPWTYYQMDVSPTPARPNWEARYLVRAYPRTVAGQLLGFEFDAASRALRVTFVPDGAAGAPTEVFASERFLYPSGLDWEVAPAGALDGSYDGEVLSLALASGVALGEAEAVTVSLRPRARRAIV